MGDEFAVKTGRMWTILRSGLDYLTFWCFHILHPLMLT